MQDKNTRESTKDIEKVYFLKAMRHCPPLFPAQVLAPSLFLYSRSDELASFERIERFAEELRGRGADVSAQRWDASEHVGKHHRELFSCICCKRMGSHFKEQMRDHG